MNLERWRVRAFSCAVCATVLCTVGCGGDGGEGAVPAADLGDAGARIDSAAASGADSDGGVFGDATVTEPADAGPGQADATPGPIGPRPSTPPVIAPGTPVYEVPVSTQLAPYARYPVPEVAWTVKDGTRRLEYVLPADLVGSPQQVELTGPEVASGWTLTGESFGSATCTQTGVRVVCMEQLAGVPIDMAALEQRAAAGELSAEQLQVARTFASDPIGILIFDAR
jgi:hypothetical protein